MIKFGPSGNDEQFYSEGHSKTIEAFSWVKKLGLDLFEYSLGNGITLKNETANLMGVEAEKNGIEVSIHAPYFINFANPSLTSKEKSIKYVLDSLELLKNFRGKKCVIHSGTTLSRPRNEALKTLYEGYDALLCEVYKNGYNNFYLCPETMGKYSQIGTYEEIINLCKLDKCLIPTLDFGHINCILQGKLKTKEDFKEIFDYSFNALGEFKTKNLHIHFSKIQYSEKGEMKHLDFSDTTFGPNFEPLIEAIIDYDLSPTIICESKGKMAIDAKTMKEMYLKSKNNQKLK